MLQHEKFKFNFPENNKEIRIVLIILISFPYPKRSEERRVGKECM